MVVGRYELTEVQWRRINVLLPGRAGMVGRPAADNRLFVQGVLWALRSGMRWEDMPERYGKYKSAHKRFTRSAAAGVWDRVSADLLKDGENRSVMIDRALCGHTSRPPRPEKKGSGERSGAESRRSDDQDSSARQLARPAALLRAYRRPGERLHPGPAAARRPTAHSRARGQGLRHRPDPEPPRRAWH